MFQKKKKKIETTHIYTNRIADLALYLSKLIFYIYIPFSFVVGELIAKFLHYSHDLENACYKGCSIGKEFLRKTPIK